MQESKFKKGDLFVYNKRLSIHNDVHGQIGVVLENRSRTGQYKVQVSHKTLWITDWSMEKI
jgi:hypothetical protein